jgi:hypothetical protein
MHMSNDVPLGVLGVIAPWNYPVSTSWLERSHCSQLIRDFGMSANANDDASIPMRIINQNLSFKFIGQFHNMLNHIISGIFAGNAVVGKVSEHTSWCVAVLWSHRPKGSGSAWS